MRHSDLGPEGHLRTEAPRVDRHINQTLTQPSLRITEKMPVVGFFVGSRPRATARMQARTPDQRVFMDVVGGLAGRRWNRDVGGMRPEWAGVGQLAPHAGQSLATGKAPDNLRESRCPK